MLIDLAARRVHLRVVYYGPAFGGKTTNVAYIAEHVPPRAQGELLSLAGMDERTLFFDALPLHLGEVGGWQIDVNLVTVPGQPSFERTRIAVLQGTDGVVFVADSDPAQQDANAASLAELERNLAAAGHEPSTFPLVVQANKRDLAAPLPLAKLRDLVRLTGRPLIPACALSGDGVFETLRTVCKLAVANV